MDTVQSDAGDTIALGDVTRIQFVAASNPPVNQQALLDGDAVSPISELNIVRVAVGDGNGATGWVRAQQPGSNLVSQEQYVQLSQVDSVSYANAGSGQFAILKKNGVVLGEVRRSIPLMAVKAKFPP